ncbi:MAG: formate dehydrogenase subunit gamma, partial [Rhodocyclales bacterium]|nr:formate dehydrogenase subunit gamma [Rhodocyclales bacterium]
YTAHERANHWLVGMCFILLALSGLAFFHPLFWPLTNLFGGGTWARILHPYVGVVLAIAFGAAFLRFRPLNVMTPTDWEWVRRLREMAAGDDHGMPAQGKYNGGQKLMFWILATCVALLTISGVLLWRAWFTLPVDLVRAAAVIHALAATVMIGLVIIHIYAAIWTKGTLRAMWYGTVTRAWAKQHHRNWYRQMTGDPR